MRYLFPLSFLLLLFPSLLFAQDLIVKKNGKHIKCVVFEETPDAIKYRKYSDPNGPIFKISRDKIYKVNYAIDDTTGQVVKDTMPLQFSKNFWGIKIRYGDEKLNNLEVKELMKDQPEAIKEFIGGKTINALAGIIGFTGSFMLFWELGRYLNTHEVNGVVLAIGGTFFVSSILMDVAGTAKIKRSVEIYNQTIDQAYKVSLKFGLTMNGVGVSLKF